VQLKIEVEVVGPEPAQAGRDKAATENDHEHEVACRRALEGAPLLGSSSQSGKSVIGFEAHGGTARWYVWRTCSLARFGVYVSCATMVILLALAALHDPLWGWLKASWQSILIVGLILGLVCCCLKSRTATRPIVANTPRQQLRPGSGGRVRILSLNICLLPAGINFSGKCLCDGNDRKAERLRKLADLLDDFDIVLLNEMWGSPWSGHHGRFTATALAKGFNVVTDPIGVVSNTGNMILSRFPLKDASSIIFKSHAGWQSMVPNGVLHATCQMPTGEPLHLFTTHLQCTTAPPQELLPPASPSAADAVNKGILDLLEKGEVVSGATCDRVRKQQLKEIKAFMDSVIPTNEDKFLLGGDLNIEGGSPEYVEMTRLFGRQSLCAPSFPTTYNTESFLTPPGWRGVEYSVCLDHMISNLAVEDFSVLQEDLSDHRGLAALVVPPQHPEGETAPPPHSGRHAAHGAIGSAVGAVGGGARGAWHASNSMRAYEMVSVELGASTSSPLAPMAQSGEARSLSLAGAAGVEEAAGAERMESPSSRGAGLVAAVEVRGQGCGGSEVECAESCSAAALSRSV
jgi:endonuclease/exonuclease/phosphatase family metal-dependent hydrolase